MEYWSIGVLDKTAFRIIQSEMMNKQSIKHGLSM
jgi:hypothetical protein